MENEEKYNVVPVGKMFSCRREKLIDSDIIIPDTQQGEKLSVLVVEEIGNECRFVKKGDIILMKPKPISFGSINIFDTVFIMCSEEDVGLILRKNTK